MEAEVRHRRDGDSVDVEVEREDGEDLVAVDRPRPARRPRASGRRRRRTRCRGRGRRADGLREQREVGRAAADVDVRPVRLVADRRDLRAELLERLRREPGVGAVRAVDRDPKAGEVGAEALEHVLEVAVRSDLDAVDLAAAGRRPVEQRLDLLLGGVGQLAAVAVEELDAVVLGRVVRGGDDRAEIEAEQRDRRSRQHAGEDGAPAGGGDAARERLLELRARWPACRARRRSVPGRTRAPPPCRAARRARPSASRRRRRGRRPFRSTPASRRGTIAAQIVRTSFPPTWPSPSVRNASSASTSRTSGRSPA